MIISNDTVFYKHHKVLVECDFKASPKCRGQYLKLYKNVLKGRENNDGKDRCQYCFNSLTKTGKNNFNFKYEKDENFFESIDSELKAYLLGWIAGDGCLKKDGLYFEIHEDDGAILKLFQDNISPNNPCYKRSGEKGLNTICWKINSVKIVKDLLLHLKLEAVGKKSYKITMPDLSDDLKWAFVRGLFDSDGSIISPLSKATRPEANICTMSNSMRENLKSLLDMNHIKYTSNDKYPSIYFGGQHCLDFLDKIYKESNFFLQRKVELYMIWKTWNPMFGTDVKPRKIRTDYPEISEEHKEKIRESNRKRKGRKYERTAILCD